LARSPSTANQASLEDQEAGVDLVGLDAVEAVGGAVEAE